MIRFVTAIVLCVSLGACNMGGGKMSDQISNGVPVSTKPIAFFKKGLTGATKIEPSIMTAQFDFTCEAAFDGRSPQARADASVQYSALAREKVAPGFPINARIRTSYMKEVFDRSVAEQGCAPTKINFASQTRDSAAVMQFVLDNKLLTAMMKP